MYRALRNFGRMRVQDWPKWCHCTNNRGSTHIHAYMAHRQTHTHANLKMNVLPFFFVIGRLLIPKFRLSPQVGLQSATFEGRNFRSLVRNQPIGKGTNFRGLTKLWKSGILNPPFIEKIENPNGNSFSERKVQNSAIEIWMGRGIFIGSNKAKIARKSKIPGGKTEFH